MNRHNTISYKDNTDNNMVTNLNTIDTSASYTHTGTYIQVDHIMDNSSHNIISSHSNNMGNKINTISTVGTIYNYTQLVSFSDTGRHSNISSNFPNTGKNMIITINTTGIEITISRWTMQVILVDIISSLVAIILIILS